MSEAPAALIASLREVIARALTPLLPRGSRVALVDFPNYANAGDSAIWVGELAFLQEAGCHIVYTCDARSYSRDRLARRLGSGTILMQGGGNFGDLYPKHQAFRERIVGEFPNNRIIALPQTIHFTASEQLQHSRTIFNAHRQLTLLVRDRQSLAIARNDFLAQSLLVPDMAFYVTPDPPRRAALDTVRLFRDEMESTGAATTARERGLGACDWPSEPSVLARAFAQLNKWSLQAPTRFARSRERLWSAGASGVARQRLARACALLSTGRVIITDRLHGHILSVLLGRPHVVLENSYGKLGSFIDTWTSQCPLTHRADSFDAAEQIAAALAADQARRTNS